MKLKRKPKAIIGDFACGFKLIKLDTAWFKEIKKSLGKRKIVAVEMEGEGVAAFCSQHKIPFIMIKGISDFADAKKSDLYAKFSSEAAAGFLFDLLKRSAEGILYEK